eukprot:357162-Chlamydomonas_euryale.AAC.8
MPTPPIHLSALARRQIKHVPHCGESSCAAADCGQRGNVMSLTWEPASEKLAWVAVQPHKRGVTSMLWQTRYGDNSQCPKPFEAGSSADTAADQSANLAYAGLGGVIAVLAVGAALLVGKSGGYRPVPALLRLGASQTVPQAAVIMPALCMC